MKKLFGGLAMNFWYGIEEDVLATIANDGFLVASALGSDMVTIKKL